MKNKNMRWNTRIAILAGVGCVIAAVFYFRVFHPGQSYSAVTIDFQEPPADPFELVLANQSRSDQNKSQHSARPGPEPTTYTPLIASGPRKITLEQTKPQAPAPAKRIVMEVRPKPKSRIYTVKEGDSLWRIARDQLGDSSRQIELAKLNAAVLGGDPDNLKLGQKLILPPK